MRYILSLITLLSIIVTASTAYSSVVPMTPEDNLAVLQFYIEQNLKPVKKQKTSKNTSTKTNVKITQVDPFYYYKVKGTYMKDPNIKEAVPLIAPTLKVTKQHRPPQEGKFARNLVLQLAYTIWAESNKTKKSMMEIMSVIQNRVESPYYPNDYISVIHAPGAFIAWGDKGDEQIVTVDHEIGQFKLAIMIVVMMYNKDIKPVNKALQYVSSSNYEQVKDYLDVVYIDETEGRVFTTFRPIEEQPERTYEGREKQYDI